MAYGRAGVSCPVCFKAGIFDFSLGTVCAYFESQVELIGCVLTDCFLQLVYSVEIIGLVSKDRKMVIRKSRI